MQLRLLHVYLRDHFAGSVAGVELAKRSASNNAGSALGEFLRSLIPELERDQTALRAVMERVGTGSPGAKSAVAWMGEKVARLKLNGQLTGYSPLSRLEELEGLALGVEGKLRLWRTLDRLRDGRVPLRRLDFEHLCRRAERQLIDLEDHRLWAAERIVPPDVRPPAGSS